MVEIWQIHPLNMSMILERWVKATGFLAANQKALIRIKGFEDAKYIPLLVEVGIDKGPPERKEVLVKFYGGKKEKKLRQGNGVRRTSGPSPEAGSPEQGEG